MAAAIRRLAPTSLFGIGFSVDRFLGRASADILGFSDIADNLRHHGFVAENFQVGPTLSLGYRWRFGALVTMI